MNPVAARALSVLAVIVATVVIWFLLPPLAAAVSGLMAPRTSPQPVLALCTAPVAGEVTRIEVYVAPDGALTMRCAPPLPLQRTVQ